MLLSAVWGQSQVLCSALRHLEKQFMYSCKRLRLQRVNQGRLAEGRSSGEWQLEEIRGAQKIIKQELALKR